MTMRNRQILVAAGLIILGVWALSAWFGSTAPAQPSASPGPSPTGAIDSGVTFGPSGGASSSPTAGASAPAASGGTSPGSSSNPVVPSGPGETSPPANVVRWSGTWTNTSPDNATGSLEIAWAQNGSALEGIVAMEGASCFQTGGIQGTIDGDKVEFQVVARDEVSFVGTIAGDHVSGTFEMSCDGSQGTWEANHQR